MQYNQPKQNKKNKLYHQPKNVWQRTKNFLLLPFFFLLLLFLFSLFFSPFSLLFRRQRFPYAKRRLNAWKNRHDCNHPTNLIISIIICLYFLASRSHWFRTSFSPFGHQLLKGMISHVLTTCTSFRYVMLCYFTPSPTSLPCPPLPCSPSSLPHITE